MITFWGIWFLAYLGGGALAMSQGETGFFASTVDQVEGLWIKLLFLNVPLHLALALTAFMSSMVGGRVGTRVSLASAWSLTVLIVVHVGLSIAYHG